MRTKWLNIATTDTGVWMGRSQISDTLRLVAEISWPKMPGSLQSTAKLLLRRGLFRSIHNQSSIKSNLKESRRHSLTRCHQMTATGEIFSTPTALVLESH